MVIVIGAGVCGLATAWRLAQAGLQVTVLERGEAGRGASWAAAGMLAAQLEAEPGEEQLVELLLAGQRAWPAFAAELESASGVPVGYRPMGTMAVALCRDDAERLQSQLELARRLGLELEWIGGREARRQEPHLAPGICGAILSRRDHQVDPRLLLEALRIAFVRAGGRLREQTSVERISIAGGRVEGVEAGGSLLRAEAVVLAAGAWSQTLGGLPGHVLPPVRPVKGQMLALQQDPAAPLLQRVLWAPDAYLVPRADGRLLIGATMEEKGFDTRMSAGGVLQLLRGAWEALPAIDELPIVEMWAGLRPGSPDDAPLLGETGIRGLLFATGHHRNGILLAPVTADAIADSIISGAPPPLVAPFSPRRFEPWSVAQ